MLDYTKIWAGYCKTEIANPEYNLKQYEQVITDPENEDVEIFLFPELGVTGYTCGDLFKQDLLIEGTMQAIIDFTSKVKKQLVVIGAPLQLSDCLYNCAFVLNEGNVIGIVPKQYLPNTKEFYESRHFKTLKPNTPHKIIYLDEKPVSFGNNFLFRNAIKNDLLVGIEICEDLWTTIPPSSYQALGNATVLLNLSGSNEIVGKADYRRNLVAGQSGRCIGTYAYASQGPTESTSDIVFGGHCIIADNGNLIAETKRFNEEDHVVAVVDIKKNINERNQTNSFGECKKNHDVKFQEIRFVTKITSDLTPKVSQHPFVPSDAKTLVDRCEDIFNTQVAGLLKRIKKRPNTKLNIGISGGLDSTLALLVAVKAVKKLGIPTTNICGWTMPGFGTSTLTNTNSYDLMKATGISVGTADISNLSFEVMKLQNHTAFGNIPVTECQNLDEFKTKLKEANVAVGDLNFENVQARLRTLYLMSQGFVLGTGDLSELALGWCTYNGDHMSMYNVNCSIPKTLVKFLVAYVAKEADVELKKVLDSILETPVSPELLPLDSQGNIVQNTEDALGPYELHDFFMFYHLRYGFPPQKILHLAKIAFENKYTNKYIGSVMKTFYRRFFDNQFKRNCIPDGPKVGSVSLSPRGDWRMPSDTDPTLWTNLIDMLIGKYED